MSTWLVTGASRGIGFGYVRQIVERGDIVFAAVRSPDKAVELQELRETSVQGSIEIVPLDVSNPQSVASAAKVVDSILQGRGLDYLISNAAILNDLFETPSKVKTEELIDIFQTNVVGSVLVYQNFLPLLERSKRPGGPVLINMSSEAGSLAEASQSNMTSNTSYSISKAALNMLTIKQAWEKPNIIVISISPGWVKTDMGGSDAIYDVDFTVRNQLELVVAATLVDSGQFKEFDGNVLPW